MCHCMRHHSEPVEIAKPRLQPGAFLFLPIRAAVEATPETEVKKREPRLTHAGPPRFGIMHACDLTSGQPDCDPVPRVSIECEEFGVVITFGGFRNRLVKFFFLGSSI